MLGHKVTQISLINDRGIHICKSMMAYKKSGSGEVPNADGGAKKGDHMVGDYYVKFEKDFQEEWKEWLQSSEAQEHFSKWQLTQKCLDAQKKISKAHEKASKLGNAEAKENALKEVPSLFELFKGSFKDFYFGNISSIGLECSKMLQGGRLQPRVRALMTMSYTRYGSN